MTQIIYTPIIEGNKSVFLYKSNFFKHDFVEKIKQFVLSKDYRDGHCVSGREIPRKQLWFQKENKYFCKSWKNRYDRWEAASEYPEVLEQIANKIKEDKTLSQTLLEHDINLQSMDINSCLIHKYRDGDDSIRHTEIHI